MLLRMEQIFLNLLISNVSCLLEFGDWPSAVKKGHSESP